MNINITIRSLKQGNVLILPTDTLYGLGAIAYNYDAVKKVFDLKKRNYSKVLPVHYGSIELIKEDCIINDKCLELASKFWPGGLTMVLKKKEYSKLVFVKETVAVRIPNNKILLEILQALNQPIVMPSANISDCDNIFKFNEIQKIFNIDGIEDDSNLSKNPSTIIDCINDDIKILRQGVVKF